MRKVLRGDARLRIPLFQRRYAWERPQWAALWDDVASIAKQRQTQPHETHFIGSFVFAATPRGEMTNDLMVVDGQQRLITISLLLCALRDGDSPLSVATNRLIDRSLTVAIPPGSRAGPLQRLKVLPTQLDQDAFSRIIHQQPITDLQCQVTGAYQYFRHRLKKLVDGEDRMVDEVSADDMAKATIDALECVQITADEDDNVHRIFESLNNRGMDLSQADLIRNYIFMRLDRKSEDFYEYTWKPLEHRLGNPGQLTQLFWLDLVQEDPTINQSRTYAEQQRRLHRLTTQSQLRREIERIANRGSYLDVILHPDRETRSTNIRRRLQRLHDWQTTTVRPILMYLLERRQEGTVTAAQAAQAMLYLESYFVRRVVIGRATMNINRIILAAPNALEADDRPVDLALRSYLSGPGKYWTPDAELLRDAAWKPFYRHGKARQKTLILQWIEEELGDMEVEFSDKLTIEHVMPQKLTDAWRKEIRDTARSRGLSIDALHDGLVHTIGNITLTRRNSELSNVSFDEKKDILRKYGSSLRLTAEITSKHHWRPTQIEARSQKMAERIIEVWPGPVN